ncbi:hypothetical protein K437DRAFT_257223 [Tilletiaria anomala UBC 951]|uniref:Uncharacterized protein n=1 Tax=Tilletiaria anomala (strain ATCC 24038 / CBS 436.72 / UBC 951) TaxID=1037660 RepID=A0A066VRG9_TILAU|nr:uncharacterized protein K437DRAFT_257223 [Tilletiaria anomala UBC 951]KDN44086.1 hypothetical protein K437DRAFT_257223 [Tilletiaria anomala UBC 951]
MRFSTSTIISVSLLAGTAVVAVPVPCDLAPGGCQLSVRQATFSSTPLTLQLSREYGTPLLKVNDASDPFGIKASTAWMGSDFDPFASRAGKYKRPFNKSGLQSSGGVFNGVGGNRPNSFGSVFISNNAGGNTFGRVTNGASRGEHKAATKGKEESIRHIHIESSVGGNKGHLRVMVEQLNKKMDSIASQLSHISHIIAPSNTSLPTQTPTPSPSEKQAATSSSSTATPSATSSSPPAKPAEKEGKDKEEQSKRSIIEQLDKW